jgi:hypothetical protein
MPARHPDYTPNQGASERPHVPQTRDAERLRHMHAEEAQRAALVDEVVRRDGGYRQAGTDTRNE